MMRKYIAFLRGINVGGKNKIRMSQLREKLMEAGFLEVSTYLNSGNVVFSSEDSNAKLKIEKTIKDAFGVDIPVYVVDVEILRNMFVHAPAWWNTGDKGKYDNLIFILSDDSPESICKLIGEPSDELEEIQIYNQVIFWTFDRKLYQQCNWWKKTASRGIAEKLTIRTANTIRKVIDGL